CIFSIVVSTVFGLKVTIPQSLYEVARGEEVTITCNFQPKNPENRLIIISWTGEPDGSFDDEGISFGTFYSDKNQVDIDPMYEGKALIQTNLVGKESKLILKQVTLRESRRIKCRVQIPGDDEGQTLATASLAVLVPPSEPVCMIKGKAEYGQNISLTCISEEGFPAPTYKWESYDVRNVPRSFPPKTTEKDGVLSLINVSMSTSGYYICTSANKIRFAKCNLTLSVIPSRMNIGATVGVIGGCVAGVAVLVLIIYCCCKNKEKPEEFEMEPPVVEYHDLLEKKKEEDPRDLRRISIEGSIDQREKYEMKAEKEPNLQRSEDSDRNPNRRLDYDDRRERPAHRREGDRGERFDDHRDNYNSDRKDNYRDHYNDRQDRYDDRRDRYDDRYDDRRDRYDDRQYHYGDRRDRYDDHREQSNDRRDRDDDIQDRYDDRRDRDDPRRNRYDDRQDYSHYSDRNDRRNSSGDL
ncbi:cell surface A33 antigen, partial [Electrophorus electricus]|uniref:cell surface A33 antigen n=1 Tax=Electrophorus electricus TaxID=8005 RepID=UPI0015D02242